MAENENGVEHRSADIILRGGTVLTMKIGRAHV